jgi:hypothetical protein
MVKPAVSTALGIIGQVVAGIDKAFFGFTDIYDALIEGADQARQQFKDFSHFDFDPRFATRVISGDRAIEGAQDLWETIRGDLLDKFNNIVAEAEELPGLLKSLPARGPGEPLLQHTALVIQVIHAGNEKVAKLVRDVFDFTQTIDAIKQRIESLDDLFLPQTNKRIVISEKTRQRVGTLHND